ncbi:hypothetical protein Tco_0469733 [Tanacetum coccineum]
MHQFWYTVKKVTCTNSYEFYLANKKCLVDAEVFRNILDICPRVQGEDFTKVPDDESTLTFLVNLGYKGPLYKHPSMFMDHMHKPWRTLATIINKCLYGKTASNDRLRKSRIDILWGMLYTKNVNYPELIWEDFAFQIDHRMEKLIRNTKGVVIQDPPSVMKQKPADKSLMLKGVLQPLAYELLAADTMQAINESKKISRRQPNTRGSSEGTGSIPGVPDESTVFLFPSSEGTGTKPGVPCEEKDIFKAKADTTLDWGSEEESEYFEEENVNEETNWVYSDEEEEKKDDADDDKSIDLKETDDEETDDEFVHSDEYVDGDVDKEMKDAEVAETKKGNEEITDTAKAEVEKTEKVKDDYMKAGLPPTRSNLSVSSGFDVEINSLLDIKIQYEVPHIQSPSMLIVPVLVIPEHSILPPIPETTTTASLVISTITPILQQQSTPILTPPITTKAPTFTTVVLEIPTITTTAFNAVKLRVAILEKDVTELKQVDHSTEIIATIRSHVPAVQSIDLEQEPTKNTSEILKVKKEQADKQKITKCTIKSTDKAALNEYDLKHALFQTMHDSKSFNKHPTNQALYHTLMDALIANEEAIPNQGKKTKRRRTNESESSNKTSTTKETSRGKASTKGSKAGKSAGTEELVEEPIKELTYKTPNWFKQPLRPPTPDPEWNTVQVVDDAPEEPWFNNLLSTEKDPLTFDALIATPIDFSKFAMNRLKIDKLTKAHLVGPVYKLLKGTCKSSIELEYNIEECFKALTDKLDWNNLKGDCYPVKKYTTSITKTKATRYETVGIEDMKNLIVVSMKVKKMHGYGHLEEIVVRRADRQEYTFKEGDFIDLHLNDIKDMLLLVVQHNLFQLDLGVESYQKKLNLTKPQKTFPGIEFKELYTSLFDPQGVIYEDLNKQKRVMRADELCKRKWLDMDKRRSGLMVDLIDKQMLERRIIRNQERSVGARKLEMDYKLMTRTE